MTEEASTTVVFLDQSGAKQVEARIAAHVTVRKLIPNIVSRMNLPGTGPDGNPIVYCLDHKEGGRRLLDDETLPAAGVQEGHHLLVCPEIVAGGARP